MFTRTLGRSDIEVSALGMGCWAIGGPWWSPDGQPCGWGQVDDAESIRAIHAALDRGINFFDTAANYCAGHSERILGQALAGRRDQVVIATKFAHIVDEETKIVQCELTPEQVEAVPGNVRRDCENSLRRLNTDYIDLYQFHAGDYDPEKAVAVRDVLEELVAEGKIRAYGWSTDDAQRARVFAQGEHCTSIQFSFSIVNVNPEMIALCDEFDLGSVNKKPLASGILTGKFTPESTFPEDDMRHALDFREEPVASLLCQVDAVREVLTVDGRSLAQGALAWIWARSERAIPIPGFKTVAQVEDNAGALEFGPLSKEQMAEVAQILERERPPS
jgi:aryl-alcohol dehydrogenase-like predicted oxidoreductase